jgi:hypothetical protein
VFFEAVFFTVVIFVLVVCGQGVQVHTPGGGGLTLTFTHIIYGQYDLYHDICPLVNL